MNANSNISYILKIINYLGKYKLATERGVI